MTSTTVSRDNAVSIATRHGLGDSWFKAQLGRHFPRQTSPALVPTLSPVQWVPLLSPDGKTAGA